MLDTSRVNHIKLAYYFWLDEFHCSCCKTVRIHPRLLSVIGTFRSMVGVPVKIRSGYRCSRHNQDVSDKYNSLHLYGMAVDTEGYIVGINRVQALAIESGFTGVLYYPKRKFWHLDVRDGEPYTSLLAV